MGGEHLPSREVDPTVTFLSIIDRQIGVNQKSIDQRGKYPERGFDLALTRKSILQEVKQFATRFKLDQLQIDLEDGNNLVQMLEMLQDSGLPIRTNIEMVKQGLLLRAAHQR